MAFFVTLMGEYGEDEASKLLGQLEEHAAKKRYEKAKLLEAALQAEWESDSQKLSAEQRARVEAAHEAFDDDGGGTIERKELSAVDKNGAMFDQLDVSGSGEVTKLAFTAFFGRLLEERGSGPWEQLVRHIEKHAMNCNRVVKCKTLPEGRIYEIHKTMDRDGSGTIAKSELQVVRHIITLTLSLLSILVYQ